MKHTTAISFKLKNPCFLASKYGINRVPLADPRGLFHSGSHGIQLTQETWELKPAVRGGEDFAGGSFFPLRCFGIIIASQLLDKLCFH